MRKSIKSLRLKYSRKSGFTGEREDSAGRNQCYSDGRHVACNQPENPQVEHGRKEQEEDVVAVAAEDYEENGVEAAAFKDWFGDWQSDPMKSSRVLNEDDEPLVVYHGTNNEFEEFRNTGEHRTDDPISQIGTWFNQDKEQAERYGEKIMPVYLNIRRPLRLKWSDIIEWDEDKGSPKYSVTEEDLRDWLEDGNHDGIIFAPASKQDQMDNGLNDEWGSSQYVVLRSNQVKSVDNRGTFDGDSGNINQ